MHKYRIWYLVRSKLGDLPVDDGALKELDLTPFQWVDGAQILQILLYRECEVETKKLLDGIRNQVREFNREFKSSSFKNYRVWLRWHLHMSASRRLYGKGR